MVGRVPGSTRTAPMPIVIDLTGSDDEDTSITSKPLINSLLVVEQENTIGQRRTPSLYNPAKRIRLSPASSQGTIPSPSQQHRSSLSSNDGLTQKLVERTRSDKKGYGAPALASPDHPAVSESIPSEQTFPLGENKQERLNKWLKTRMIPIINKFIVRWDFDQERAREVRRDALKKIFEVKSIRRQVEIDENQLSLSAWRNIEIRAEQLIRDQARKLKMVSRNKSVGVTQGDNAPPRGMRTGLSLPQEASSPTARELKKKAAAEKLSRIMKERWARGGMACSLVTRRKNRIARGLASFKKGRDAKLGLSRSFYNSPKPPQTMVPIRRSEPLYHQQASTYETMSDTSEDNNTDTENSKRLRCSSSPTTSQSLRELSNDSKPEKRLRGSRTKLPYQNVNKNSSVCSSSQSFAQLRDRGNLLPNLARKSPRKSRERYSPVRTATRMLENLSISGLAPGRERPYLTRQQRFDLERGLRMVQCGLVDDVELQNNLHILDGAVIHVDFSQGEIDTIEDITQHIFPDRRTSVQTIVKKIRLAKERSGRCLEGRSDSAISSYLREFSGRAPQDQDQIVRIRDHSQATQPSIVQNSLLRGLLQRNIYGIRSMPPRSMTPRTHLSGLVEDTLIRSIEWTDCAGYIATITWLPDGGFLCGTITHSDHFNQQYNRPGNLMIGSCEKETLTSIPGHQIPRPIIEVGDNALPSMRETQDPWLYTSVTTTAYSSDHKIVFTGSFDNTVKIWNTTEDCSSMTLRGIWNHGGHVNFVVTSQRHAMVATTADVRDNAVRVYQVNADNISDSEYWTYSAETAAKPTDTWAYFPATIKWGEYEPVAHLLLVGYSPRSLDPHGDVPEDKANTGELCLWNMKTRARVPFTSARTQNVFEVVWHPTQPIFVVATSATGEFEDGIKTQLRLFGQSETGTFTHMTTLDCNAIDINEITVMPNSSTTCYVTASCTDGCTYVWDSAATDQPLHVLRHGTSIDDQAQGGYDAECGVKFAAWGRSGYKLYTGSSDGVVKCWNLLASADEVLVRDVATLSGGVSAGAFSPEFDRLLLGDSTGKVHLFSLDDAEPGDITKSRRRKALVPHPELPPPYVANPLLHEPGLTAAEIAHEFVSRGQIVIDPDEYIGALQGLEYSSTGLFSPSFHKKHDISRRVKREYRETRNLRYQIADGHFECLEALDSSDSKVHSQNQRKDVDLSSLSPAELSELDLNVEDDFFETEIGPSDALFEDNETNEKEMSLLSGVSNSSPGSAEAIITRPISDILSDAEIRDFARLQDNVDKETKIRRDLDCVLDSFSSPALEENI